MFSTQNWFNLWVGNPHTLKNESNISLLKNISKTKLGQPKGSCQNVVLSEPRRPSQHQLFNIKCCDFHTRCVEVALNFGDPVKYTNEDGVERLETLNVMPNSFSKRFSGSSHAPHQPVLVLIFTFPQPALCKLKCFLNCQVRDLELFFLQSSITKIFDHVIHNK